MNKSPEPLSTKKHFDKGCIECLHHNRCLRLRRAYGTWPPTPLCGSSITAIKRLATLLTPRCISVGEELQHIPASVTSTRRRLSPGTFPPFTPVSPGGLHQPTPTRVIPS